PPPRTCPPTPLSGGDRPGPPVVPSAGTSQFGRCCSAPQSALALLCGPAAQLRRPRRRAGLDRQASSCPPADQRGSGANGPGDTRVARGPTDRPPDLAMPSRRLMFAAVGGGGGL